MVIHLYLNYSYNFVCRVVIKIIYATIRLRFDDDEKNLFTFDIVLLNANLEQERICHNNVA